jgi:ATP-dependent DNA helicase HFM1/MER3
MVSNNISSIEKLDEKDATSIERIMSKNPPFGKKIKDFLAAFPRLELRTEIVSKAPFKQNKKPSVNVKAILSYRGIKTPVWEGRKPSLTFMAESSEGRIVHFWRGNIMKLEKGYELKFNIELFCPDEHIKCWIACDEIVGTVRSSILKPEIPVSHFPVQITARTEPSKPTDQAKSDQPNPFSKAKLSVETDEFGDDGIEDDDLACMIVQNVEEDESDYGSEGFADIDEVENMIQAKKTPKVKDKATEKKDAPRISNGKYACQHSCRDGQLLKNGKTCKHKCCNEGLEKPPARKRKVLFVLLEKR